MSIRPSTQHPPNAEYKLCPSPYELNGVAKCVFPGTESLKWRRRCHWRCELCEAPAAAFVQRHEAVAPMTSVVSPPVEVQGDIRVSVAVSSKDVVLCVSLLAPFGQRRRPVIFCYGLTQRPCGVARHQLHGRIRFVSRTPQLPDVRALCPPDT